MKTFTNKQTAINIAIEGSTDVKTMAYADIVLLLLNKPATSEQWSKAEMKVDFKIEDKISSLKVDESVELEDTEFDRIYQASKEEWNFKHRDIVMYVDDIAEWNN